MWATTSRADQVSQGDGASHLSGGVLSTVASKPPATTRYRSSASLMDVTVGHRRMGPEATRRALDTCRVNLTLGPRPARRCREWAAGTRLVAGCTGLVVGRSSG